MWASGAKSLMKQNREKMISGQIKVIDKEILYRVNLGQGKTVIQLEEGNGTIIPSWIVDYYKEQGYHAEMNLDKKLYISWE